MADRKKGKPSPTPAADTSGHSPRVNFRAPRPLYDRCLVLGAQLETAARRELTPTEMFRALLEAGARVLELGTKTPEQLLVDAGLLKAQPAPAPRRRS